MASKGDDYYFGFGKDYYFRTNILCNLAENVVPKKREKTTVSRFCCNGEICQIGGGCLSVVAFSCLYFYKLSQQITAKTMMEPRSKNRKSLTSIALYYYCCCSYSHVSLTDGYSKIEVSKLY
jgi:hypothetical protein